MMTEIQRDRWNGLDELSDIPAREVENSVARLRR
jgi:hypothetical protein